MYLAELHGKMPPSMERMEDILTSNVFSFFKYSDRKTFLAQFLCEIGLDVSDDDAEKAEFRFWYRFDDRTEPDLMLMVGEYYLLFEAKYFSGFGEGPEIEKYQLLREIQGGKSDALRFNKTFYLIAITADYSFKEDKFTHVPEEIKNNQFRWTNWQHICSFLDRQLQKENVPDREFADDLHRLLLRKNLREFQGFTYNLYNLPALQNFSKYEKVFFDASSAKFRGKFIGFLNALPDCKGNLQPLEKVFFSHTKQFYRSLLGRERLAYVDRKIFFRRSR